MLPILDKEIQESFQTQTKEIGDHTIAYEVRYGSAQPERTIVLCHGAFATRNTTRVLAESLATIRPEDRIILVDVPWHGESTSLRSIEGADVHTYAEILTDWLNQLIQEGEISNKLTWFGWSMGGSIGMLINLKGKIIDELVLVNSAPVWQSLEAIVKQIPLFNDVRTIYDVFQTVMANDFETGVTTEYRAEIMANYDKLVSRPEVMVNDISAINTENYDIRDNLKEISSKTLIYSTSDDMLANTNMQEILESEIPDSIKHIQEDGGHSALLKEKEADIIASCFAEVFIHN